MTKKKPKRVVLGMGHPWFIATDGGRVVYDGVYLTTKPVHPSILLRTPVPHVDLKIGRVGNWNKCRLVLEVLR